MIDIPQHTFAQIFGNGLHYSLLFIEPKFSIYMLAISLPLEHAFEIVKMNGFIRRR